MHKVYFASVNIYKRGFKGKMRIEKNILKISVDFNVLIEAQIFNFKIDVSNVFY